MRDSSGDFRIIPGSKVLGMADEFKGWIFGFSIGVKGCCRDVLGVSRGILCYVSGVGYCEVGC